jgi:putative heme-binding domain-containing protein
MKQMLLAVLVALVFAVPLRVHADDAALSALVEVLKSSDDPQFHLDILKGMSEALKGRRGVKAPVGWEALSGRLGKSPNAQVRELSQQLSVTFGSQTALAAQRAQLADAKGPVTARLAALESLVAAKDAGLPPLLPGLLKEAALREGALRAMAAFDDAKFPAAVLAAYPNLNAVERKSALATLVARPASARELLAAIAARKVAAQEVSADFVRSLRAFKQPELIRQVEQIFGVSRPSGEDTLKEITRYKALLLAKPTRAEDLSQGRLLFNKTCGQCHTLFGEGGKVGPDITGSNRVDLDYLLLNILDPNAEIAADYRPWDLETKDDRSILGLLVRQDAQVVVLQTPSEMVTVTRAEIRSLRQSPLSMMPEGLIAALSEAELRDLVAYLRSPKQVPLPAVK